MTLSSGGPPIKKLREDVVAGKSLVAEEKGEVRNEKNPIRGVRKHAITVGAGVENCVL